MLVFGTVGFFILWIITARSQCYTTNLAVAKPFIFVAINTISCAAVTTGETIGFAMAASPLWIAGNRDFGLFRTVFGNYFSGFGLRKNRGLRVVRFKEVDLYLFSFLFFTVHLGALSEANLSGNE